MSESNIFKYLFRSPQPKNPTLLESLEARNQLEYTKPDPSGIFEIFGELYFKEQSISDLYPGSKLNNSSYGDDMHLSLDSSEGVNKFKSGNDSTDNCGFSKNSSETLHHCTERLRFECSNMFNETKNDRENGYTDAERDKVESVAPSMKNMKIEDRFRRSPRGKEFPPLISSIRSDGKPRFGMRSYRYDGRLIRKEIRLPPREYLQSRREDGRLKFSFVHPSEEIDEQAGYRDDDNDHNDNEEDKVEISDGDVPST